MCERIHVTRSRAKPGGNAVGGEGKVGIRERKPPWLKVPAPGGPRYRSLTKLIKEENLNTVCREANCPNVGECWERGTATFMILGDVCTRRCGFCNVQTGTSGVLYNAADFATARNVVSGDTLNVTVTISVT